MTELNRRQFLKTSALASGGLLMTIALPGCASIGHEGMVSNSDWQANAWLHIHSDNRITFVLDRVEMGQGTYTGLVTLLVEELEVAPEQVDVTFAGVDSFYNNPIYKLQITGGSTSMASSYERIRIAGASAREMLRQAAAQVWQQPLSAVRADNGHVHFQQQSLSYGELAPLAAQQSVPEVTLKSAGQFQRIGKPEQRLDARAKVTGQAEYGIDVDLPGMLYAVVSRAPAWGATLASRDISAAQQAQGVVAVFEITAAGRQGIAVVAERYWQARKAQQRLKLDWQTPEVAPSTDSLIALHRQALEQDSGDRVRDEGDFEQALASSKQVLEAEYQLPHLAHATLEPQNCVVDARPNAMEVWAPTQSASMARVAAGRHSRYSLDDIKVHTTWIGGGFGRRIMQDYISECAAIADHLQRPVKLIWSREEDTQHDLDRPARVPRLAAASHDGDVQGWQHRLAHPKVFDWFADDAAPAQYPFMPKFMFPALASAGKAGEGIIAPSDTSAYEGAHDLPYDFKSLQVDFVHSDPGVPVGYWRSVGHSHNGFVTESFVDELAHHTHTDPLAFRLRHLAQHPQAVALLNAVAKAAHWGQPLAGCQQGIAIHKSFGSWVAQVADVQVEGEQIKVKRVVCGVDCGLAVNPDTVKAQMEGGIIFALTATLHGEITLQHGEVQQSNFHDYPLARMTETPQLEVFIMPSQQAPTGVGEPGVPPLAATVANAVFAASGQRLRSLPLRLTA
jgi:CO/xanthine dehydrogenase Mo-binding subunit